MGVDRGCDVHPGRSVQNFNFNSVQCALVVVLLEDYTPGTEAVTVSEATTGTLPALQAATEPVQCS